ncbi:MAG: HU family DNA-binding protein [Candidatus Phytoplasma stylosanthis]|uniref:HU family DNA-binding protein n=1 Tax=Candidatus Phytoplasma stylosanthis TaxID=2798314 RepID=UPI00293B6BD4|nr:HU family DNA-binding protein [Candidatus Phytoplasma stylosanthis]MDV3168044.1 HU family DNA-binding protein [Candidatus Phytoplasma stylosanthis]MDV3170808.1 HU family DNA-binding protein [Candidatus Phytoplasma stylosanthis]MDV3173596.1 HU family DNA-binding protein [Candidatus Phytoplasma stylosanthis]MDV3174178.1 HU family DNA-binding protein [Candidatus Phytoplasma stylosanthis]MDV3196199.1 HU family DNA-binding protein [Candidatus Phytoplasma stylosanthis]
MNKLELINKLSEDLGVKKDQVENFFASLNKIIIKNLKNKKESDPQVKMNKVIVGDLGAVHLKHRKERICKVPKSDKVLTIPAKDVPVFKIGKKFMDLFNG